MFEIEEKKQKDKFKYDLQLQFYNAAWQKKDKLSLQDLKDVFRSMDKKQMTAEEMLNQVKSLNAMFGGVTKKVGD